MPDPVTVNVVELTVAGSIRKSEENVALMVAVGQTPVARSTGLVDNTMTGVTTGATVLNVQT